MKYFSHIGQQAVKVYDPWKQGKKEVKLLLPQSGSKAGRRNPKGPNSHTDLSRQGLEFGDMKATNFRGAIAEMKVLYEESSGDLQNGLPKGLAKR